MTEPGKTQDELTQRVTSSLQRLTAKDLGVVAVSLVAVTYLVVADGTNFAWMLCFLPIVWGYLRRSFGVIFAGHRNEQTVTREGQTFWVRYFPEGSATASQGKHQRYKLAPRVEIWIEGAAADKDPQLLDGWLAARCAERFVLAGLKATSESSRLVFWAREGELPKELPEQKALLEQVLLVAREVAGLEREALEAWAADSSSPKLRLIAALAGRAELLPGIVEDELADVEVVTAALERLQRSLADDELAALALPWLASPSPRVVASGLTLASGLGGALNAQAVAAAEGLVRKALERGALDERWTYGLTAAVRCLEKRGGVSAVPGLLALSEKPWRKHRMLRGAAQVAARNIQSRLEGAEAGSFSLAETCGESGALSMAGDVGALSMAGGQKDGGG